MTPWLWLGYLCATAAGALVLGGCLLLLRFAYLAVTGWAAAEVRR